MLAMQLYYTMPAQTDARAGWFFLKSMWEVAKMPRVALSMEQKRDYKLKDFKLWVIMQMHEHGRTQEDVGKVIGVSQSTLSKMLKIPKKGEKDRRIKPDPFTYGQVLMLCEYFGADEKARKRLLTM